MSSRLQTVWSGRARLLGALLVSLLGVGSCGSPSRPTSPGPVLGDRRELPPVPVAAADAGPSLPPGGPAAPPVTLPRTLALGALAEGERVADLAVLAQEDHFLLAWVTYFDGGGPAPSSSARGRAKTPSPPASAQQKRGATVMVRALDTDGEALGGANTLSVKADSIGGVSLAAGASQGDAGLAWVGKDAGVGQVFVTRLSRTGEKQAQRMVTHSKEGCSDVALVRHKDGFIVAYVNSQNRASGVYVAKVGKDLQPIGPERLVAHAKGEASDVRMLARGEELAIVWVEARQNLELHGVFAARLLAADLSVRGDPAPVALAPQHARGIDLAALGDGLALGWVEESPPSAAATNARTKTAVLVRFDFPVRGPAEPMRVSLPAQASSIALDCDRACRVVVAGSEGDELSIYGFLYDGAVLQPPARLASIPGVSTEDTNPVISRDWLFFAEDDLHGAGRIRKARLAWR